MCNDHREFVELAKKNGIMDIWSAFKYAFGEPGSINAKKILGMDCLVVDSLHVVAVVKGEPNSKDYPRQVEIDMDFLEATIKFFKKLEPKVKPAKLLLRIHRDADMPISIRATEGTVYGLVIAPKILEE